MSPAKKTQVSRSPQPGGARPSGLVKLVGLLVALVLAPLPAAADAAPVHKRIALTFDCLARRPGAYFTPDERTRRLVAALRRFGVRQAALFIIPGNLEQPFGQGMKERSGAYIR